MHETAGMIENVNSTYDPEICKKTFQRNDVRVRDHCHWGRAYIRGLAHESCNLNYRATYFIPVVVPNSRNYDSHLILNNDSMNAINIIPVKMEKFTP
ncbi:c2H2-type domain-containing protein [Trichonephila clavipes]|nr:c2H2-type domain-containing protein [Trichonephila clavipes]